MGGEALVRVIVSFFLAFVERVLIKWLSGVRVVFGSSTSTVAARGSVPACVLPVVHRLLLVS